MKNEYTIGSRESQLALIQTNLVKDQLMVQHPSATINILKMTTKGDQILDIPLSAIGEKSLFTKELEHTLLNKTTQFLVHSLKDLPTALPPTLSLSVILERENPNDVLVVKKGLAYKSIQELPDGSVIGTSSRRRISQLKKMFPKLVLMDIRGNLNTRLTKLDSSTLPYSAIILAHAGLVRLGFSDRITQQLPFLYHAVGQGALAIESVENDIETEQFIRCLMHWETYFICLAERSFLRKLEGGCSVPIGCRSQLFKENGKWWMELKGSVARVDGSQEVKCEIKEEVTEFNGWNAFNGDDLKKVKTFTRFFEDVGIRLAENMEKLGVKEILKEIFKQERDAKK